LNSQLSRDPKKLVRQSLMAILLGVSLYFALLILLQLTQSSDDTGKELQRLPSAKLMSWNWFSGDSTVVEAAGQDHDELPEANINAVLLGVMIAGDNSFATLKFNGKPEAVYHRGDDLNYGYQLLDIEPYRIVVRKNGLNQQVLMKKPDSIIETRQVPDEQAAQQPTEGFALANMFGAVPVAAAGGSGLKLNNLSSDITSMADLQEGDVVIRVDGASVQELMANPGQWANYSGNSNLPVTVMRQGQEQTIYVNAASLAAKMLPNIGLSR
jgi:type II secretory pathway component PulC